MSAEVSLNEKLDANIAKEIESNTMLMPNFAGIEGLYFVLPKNNHNFASGYPKMTMPKASIEIKAEEGILMPSNDLSTTFSINNRMDKNSCIYIAQKKTDIINNIKKATKVFLYLFSDFVMQ